MKLNAKFHAMDLPLSSFDISSSVTPTNCITTYRYLLFDPFYSLLNGSSITAIRLQLCQFSRLFMCLWSLEKKTLTSSSLPLQPSSLLNLGEYCLLSWFSSTCTSIAPTFTGNPAVTPTEHAMLP